MLCQSNGDRVSDTLPYNPELTSQGLKKGQAANNISIRKKSDLEKHMVDNDWAVFRLGDHGTDKTCFAIAQANHIDDFFFTKDEILKKFEEAGRKRKFVGGTILAVKNTPKAHEPFKQCLPNTESGILSRVIATRWKDRQSKGEEFLAATNLRYKKNIEFEFKPTDLDNTPLTYREGRGNIEVDAVILDVGSQEILVIEAKHDEEEVFKGQIAYSYMAVRKRLEDNLPPGSPLPKITPVIVFSGSDPQGSSVWVSVCYCDWNPNLAITEMKIGEVYAGYL